MALSPMEIENSNLLTQTNTKTVSSTWQTIVSKALTPGIYILEAYIESNESLTTFGGKLIDGAFNIYASDTVQNNQVNTGFTMSAILEVTANTTFYAQAFGIGSTTATITGTIKAYKLV